MMYDYSYLMLGVWNDRTIELNERRLEFFRYDEFENEILDGVLNFDMYACSIEKEGT